MCARTQAAGIPQEPTSPTSGTGGSNDTSNGRSPSKGGAASEDPVHRSAHEVIGVLLEPVGVVIHTHTDTHTYTHTLTHTHTHARAHTHTTYNHVRDSINKCSRGVAQHR